MFKKIILYKITKNILYESYFKRNKPYANRRKIILYCGFYCYFWIYFETIHRIMIFYLFFSLVCLVYIFYTLFVAKNIIHIHNNAAIKRIINATNFLILVLFVTIYFVPPDFKLFDFSIITFLVVVINTLFTLFTKDNLFDDEVLLRYALTSFLFASFVIPSFYVFRLKVLEFYILAIILYFWAYFIEKHLKEILHKKKFK